MIQDNSWIFQASWAMPNATTDICDNYIDWTASKWKDFINTPMPMWLMVVCTTVPSAGTSIKVEIYQHSTTTLTSGDMLLEGPIITVANLSASAQDDGHVLLCVPMLTLMVAAQTMSGQDRYFGPVLRAAGDCSTGVVESWLHMGANPPIYVSRPTASNIVMPT